MEPSKVVQYLVVHDTEISQLQHEVEQLELIVEGTANLLASLVEKYPGELTEMATALRMLLFDRRQLRERKSAERSQRPLRRLSASDLD